MVTAECLVQDIQKARRAGEDARDLRETLWLNCREVVGSLASRYTRHNPQWRDDLVSEAYLKFEQALASFDPHRGVPFRGFLSGCVQRLFIDRLRRRSEPSVEFADDLPGRSPPADDRLRVEELSEHVHETLDALLPRDHLREEKIAAFKLRHIEGWSVEEIRARMHVDCANTVSQWIHRVRRAFEEEFPRRHPEYFVDAVDGESPGWVLE